MTNTPKPYRLRDSTPMTPMSVPQSTWCAGSYPYFRARCKSGLRVVDAKIRTYDGRLTQPIDSCALPSGCTVRNTAKDRTEGEIMKVKLDTTSLIALAIGLAIWVLVIWTAIAAIVAHI
jgi:hypothetical protein